MGTSIDRIHVLRGLPRIAMADAAELLAEHEGQLPEECLLREVADKEPDADGYVVIDRFLWRGEGSGNSYYDIFQPHVAPKIMGDVDAIVHWDGYDPSGLRIRDGKVTEPRVLMDLEDA